MDKEELKRLISELNTPEQYEALANRLISTSVPWFFISKYGEESITKYSEFKWYMSSKFGITSNDVSLAGSAWLGYSLNPKKNFRDFQEGSDIDIVIVSQRLFNLFWDCYFKELTRGALSGEIYVDLSKNTFKRFVDYQADEPLNISQTFYRNFRKRINGYARDLQVNFDFPSRIGYRIYRSWEDYRMNIIHNLKDVKAVLECR